VVFLAVKQTCTFVCFWALVGWMGMGAMPGFFAYVSRLKKPPHPDAKN
jgi:hypothetical protein